MWSYSATSAARNFYISGENAQCTKAIQIAFMSYLMLLWNLQIDHLISVFDLPVCKR